MWDLIVSVPDHCLSFYYEKKTDLDLVIRKSYQNIHFSHVFFKFWMYTACKCNRIR